MPASGRDQELFELISKMQYYEMRQIWSLTTEPSSSAAGSQQPVEIKAEVAEERGAPGDARANLQEQPARHQATRSDEPSARKIDSGHGGG